jgi:hypothetical protein
MSQSIATIQETFSSFKKISSCKVYYLKYDYSTSGYNSLANFRMDLNVFRLLSGGY